MNQEGIQGIGRTYLRIDTSGGGVNFGALFLLNMDKLFPKAIDMYYIIR